MTTNKHGDILDEMSRVELLAWLRSRTMLRPKRSELLYLRWQMQSEALMVERDKENRSMDGLDFAERDRLAVKFNESKDAAEKLRLIKKIGKYDQALGDHIERSRKLDRKQQRVDRLYEQIDIELKREARA